MKTLPLQVQQTVQRALEEDLSWGDITTEALIPRSLEGKAVALAKADGVLAGLQVFALAFHLVNPAVRVEALVAEGHRIHQGMHLARVEGPAISILKGERTALNFLQRLSGIATETARYVEAVKGLPARIVDTRKTTPGLRWLDKYAVRVGGGHNHRFNLGDGILIKDNHIAACRAQGMTLADIIDRMRAYAPHTLKVEIEVVSVEMAVEAADAGADAILLDNMSPEQMKEAVRAIGGRALTEASGGIRLNTVRAVAETGVDIISVGALTHSVSGLDISLELEV